MKRTLAIVLALASACAPVTSTPTPRATREPGTLSVVALLDLSGERASTGAAQREGLQIAADRLGGSRKVRLQWRAVDVGGSEARLLIALRRAVVDEGTDAVIFGTPLAALSPQLLRAADLAAVPILLAAPAPDPSASRVLFALAPGPDEVARVVDADLQLRGTAASTLRADPRSVERIDQLQLAGVRSLVLTGSPKEYGRLASVLRASVFPPATYFDYLTDPQELGDFRELPTFWPGSRHVVSSAARAAQPSALREFVQVYTQRRGPPPTAAASAYDALALLAAVAEKRGDGEPAGVRETLETMSFDGIAGSYSFGPGRHAAFRSSDLTLLRWANGAVTTAR